MEAIIDLGDERVGLTISSGEGSLSLHNKKGHKSFKKATISDF